MLTVTPAFKTATTATIRHPTANVDFIWTDVYIDPLLDTDPDHDNENYNIKYARTDNDSNISKQVANNIISSSFEYALLDGSWTLDGTKRLGPHTPDEILANEIGWYSAAVCDTDGVFSTPPKITVKFQARLLTSLRVAGYSDTQYPTDFDIWIYDADDEELYHNNYTNTARVWGIDIDELVNCTKMILQVNEWSVGSTVAKIMEFYTVEKSSFDGDMIVNLNLLEEREIRNGSSPIGNISCNEIDLTLQNIKINGVLDPFMPGNTSTPFQNFLTQNRRVIAYYGFNTGSTTEYVKIGTFWTDDWQCKDSEYTVKISAQDRMKFLKSASFEGEVLFDISLYELAIYVLRKAKLLVIQDLEYSIDTELSNINIPVAYFDKVSYFEVLRSIAECACGTCYMSKDDILIIESYKKNYNSTVSLNITRDNIFSKDQPINRDDMRNYITVDINTLSLKTEDNSTSIDIYKMADDSDPYTIEGSQQNKIIEVEYYQNPAFDQVVTIKNIVGCVPVINYTKSKFFSWGCRLYINNNSAVAGTFKFDIKGKVYDSTVKDKKILPATDDVDGQNLIKEYGKKELSYKNHLVQDSTTASIIAQALYDSYSLSRRDVIVEWRGDPSIELGDCIQVPDYGTSTVKVVVYKNNFSFDGGLKCSTSARKVIEEEE